MATYVNTINGNKIFADRAENTKKGVNIDDKLEALEAAIAANGAFEVVALNAQGKPDVASPKADVIYLTKESGSTKTDPYTEWIYVGSAWEVIGETSIDLSGYYTSAQVDSALSNKVDKESGKGLSTNDYTTTEKNKLAGISAGAEMNVQSDWNVTDTAADAYIKNKPALKSVATSGSYNDLTDKPTIPAAQVNSDWNATSGVAQILNKPSIPTVGTVELT